MDKTFTSLRELKSLLDGLSEEQLDASLNMHDWYVFDLVESKSWRLPSPWYFSIEGKDGGEA